MVFAFGYLLFQGVDVKLFAYVETSSFGTDKEPTRITKANLLPTYSKN
jgi:hypothetical protein